MLSIKSKSNTIIIKKSKFIVNTYCVFNELDALSIINDTKLKYKDANHNCYAYIVDNIKRFNDDGEPSGTAGIPIFDILEKNNLNYSLVIITRYFGGIKLGANGLIRAYSKCTKETLDIIELIKGKTIEIEFDYKDEKYINNIIKKEDIIESSYKEKVKYIANVKDIDLIKLNNYKIIKDIFIKV